MLTTTCCVNCYNLESDKVVYDSMGRKITISSEGDNAPVPQVTSTDREESHHKVCIPLNGHLFFIKDIIGYLYITLALNIRYQFVITEIIYNSDGYYYILNSL